MLKLCGFPVSNYYNKVKIALLEKGIAFEEEWRMRGQESMAAGSPLGKVPFLKTPQGTFCESQAIVEYLEEVYPNAPLYPRDPYARAKCRELIHFMELYIELPARRLYPEAFFGGSVSAETKQTARADLEKGIKALAQTAKFAPHIAGADFTYADCVAFAVLPLAAQATSKIYGEDLTARLPGIGAYLEQLRARPSVKKVGDDRKANLERFAAAAKNAA